MWATDEAVGAWTAAPELAADCFYVNFIVLLVAACVRVEGVVQDVSPYVL